MLTVPLMTPQIGKWSRVRVTGEHTHGDEENFVAVAIEPWAPTSVIGNVAFSRVPSVSTLRLNTYCTCTDGKKQRPMTRIYMSRPEPLLPISQLWKHLHNCSRIQSRLSDTWSVGFGAFSNLLQLCFSYFKSKSNPNEYCCLGHHPGPE